MAKTVVGIMKTGEYGRHEIWRHTFDGHILGDSRGYDKHKAIEEAVRLVHRDPDYKELHPDLKPFAFR